MLGNVLQDGECRRLLSEGSLAIFIRFGTRGFEGVDSRTFGLLPDGQRTCVSASRHPNSDIRIACVERQQCGQSCR